MCWRRIIKNKRILNIIISMLWWIVMIKKKKKRNRRFDCGKNYCRNGNKKKRIIRNGIIIIWIILRRSRIKSYWRNMIMWRKNEKNVRRNDMSKWILKIIKIIKKSIIRSWRRNNERKIIRKIY